MSGYSVVHTKEAPPVDQIPLSQAIKTPFAIFLSGQIPATPDGALVTGSITDKTRQIIANLRAVLTEAGSSIDKVVKVKVFLADMAYFAEMNEEYAQWFTHKPARSCVAVRTLPLNVDVEMEAIALP
ncbi:hypothetical protein BN1708_015171 [Verticillium longisporum]|uniref:Uncharacterized protein n=2 Tax=Verticillium longisporum TaxID=100787 RepID=A0A0G4M200_VERLO|nr:hypothetical protein BN1708_015171 [Verticillium longisporum]